MSNLDQVAEAHRLQRERSYGARRVAAELGISRELAGELLAAPDPAQDPRVAAVTKAILATVAGARATSTMVTITHRHTVAGHQACETWTGRPGRLAELIVAALDTEQVETIRGQVHAALAPLLEGGAR
ncbi:hypothetical protein [Streptomyces sp. NPDC005760]|uniref:hypothetical protein n=1 Tax=Streptomyces sp. NPDC005760 TaxID=3156718 RepID=UPI0033F45F61